MRWWIGQAMVLEAGDAVVRSNALAERSYPFVVEAPRIAAPRGTVSASAARLRARMLNELVAEPDDESLVALGVGEQFCELLDVDEQSVRSPPPVGRSRARISGRRNRLAQMVHDEAGYQGY